MTHQEGLKSEKSFFCPGILERSPAVSKPSKQGNIQGRPGRIQKDKAAPSGCSFLLLRVEEQWFLTEAAAWFTQAFPLCCGKGQLLQA